MVDPRATAENELRLGAIGLVDRRKLVFERHERTGKSEIKTEEVILRKQVLRVNGHIQLVDWLVHQK